MKKEKFSKRLQLAMDLKNIKAIELAKKTSLNRDLISNYLSENYKPKDENLEKIADVLGVNELWLKGYNVPKDVEWLNRINCSENNIIEKEKFYSGYLNDDNRRKKINDIFIELTEDNKIALVKYASYLLYEQKEERK